MMSTSFAKERGLTLVGLILIMALAGFVGVLALKVVPSAIEFMSVKKAMAAAKQGATTALEIKRSFDRQATTGYIDSVSSKDLDIIKDGDQFEVSIAYEKKIPLVGQASLLIEYAATTAPGSAKKPGV